MRCSGGFEPERRQIANPVPIETIAMTKACTILTTCALTVAVLAAGPVYAHGAEGLTGQAAWSAWSLTPQISGPILLVLAIYAHGAWRRRTASRPYARLRHTVFVAGMLALFLSLQSPLDPMGERLFLAHQIQHLLLRMIGPMLVMLARPQGVFIAGLPNVLRRFFAAPLMTNSALSRFYDFLTHPTVAFILFVLSMYAWQIPSIHNVALLDPLIHWSMHLTMLIAGLLFFAMIFSPRDRPSAAPHALRVLLLFATIVSNILLGAIIAFKSTVIYTAYDIEGRLFGIMPLTDESIGGFILWVPASMMSIIAIIIVVYDWNAIEKKRLRRGYAMGQIKTGPSDYPISGNESRANAAASNRRLALMLMLTVMVMFTLIMGTAIFVVSLG